MAIKNHYSMMGSNMLYPRVKICADFDIVMLNSENQPACRPTTKVWTQINIE